MAKELPDVGSKVRVMTGSGYQHGPTWTQATVIRHVSEVTAEVLLPDGETALYVREGMRTENER